MGILDDYPSLYPINFSFPEFVCGGVNNPAEREVDMEVGGQTDKQPEEEKNVYPQSTCAAPVTHVSPSLDELKPVFQARLPLSLPPATCSVLPLTELNE